MSKAPKGSTRGDEMLQPRCNGRSTSDDGQITRVRRFWWRAITVFGLTVGALVLLGQPNPAIACGGLFCQNDPVDQVGERIVFSVNDDQSVTSLIEIQYTGTAADFSWILPVPTAIGADDLAVPDDGDAVFTELHRLTDVRVLAPPTPGCAQEILADFASDDDAAESESGVEVFASGEVGPFGFDVIGSADPMALIDWLRDNNYRVEPPMEPLIDVYVEEEFAFVAMRLLDGEEADAIMPIEITYPGDQPMIPIRLTAVAAMPEMPVYTWIFAEEQAVPQNYAHMEVATEEITFSDFGGNDYRQLVQRRADANNGQAFITEFAGSANSLDVVHPYLQGLVQEHGYLTRLTTFISPEEMTVDPVFTFDGDRDDVSNVRDARELKGLYRCEREGGGGLNFGQSSDAINPINTEGEVAAATPSASGGASSGVGLLVGLGLIVIAAVGGVAYWAGRRGSSGPDPQPGT